LRRQLDRGGEEMTLTPGTRLGPYEISGVIGAGGMGEVYKAKDSRLGRDVAIKVLPTSFADDPDRRARFEREAQAVAALSHPNVIAIFDTGVHEDPSTGSGQANLYVVMELLTGQTLRERLAAGPMPVRKAVDTAVQIARGLGAAHGKGIVHRDLKPENVFLLDDGQVKILDFGLARQAAETAHSGATQTMAMTGAGTVMGTVGYMAPEQVRGLVVDARADVFAFGAVLYEMVSGQRAFQRDTAADTMTAILTQDPPELVGSRPDLPPALDRIIRHCLEKNANERFQNARDIAFALGALSGSTTATSSGAVAAIPATEAVRRPRAALVTMAAVGGALLVGAGAGYFARGATPATVAAVNDVSYRPVSFEDGFVFTARFAPDGRTIVYSADWNRQPRGVYVTSLDSLEYRLLGFPGADLLGVSKSGDLAVLTGSTISGGKTYWRLGTLAKASLTGGSSRPEMEGVRFADFGSDGAMAVVREDGQRSTMEYPAGQVLAEGSTVGFRGVFASPRVSPSGEHVAFFDIHVPSAYTVKVFSKSGKLVAESGPFNDWWALAWTPANEVWYAAAPDAGSQTSIFGLDLAGKERVVWRAPGAVTLHDISPQGDVLVSFDRGRARTELLEGPQAAPVDRSWREGGRLAAFSNNHTLLINGVGDSGGVKGSVYAWLPGAPQPVRIADGTGVAISPDGSKALVVARETPLKVSIVPTGTGQPRALDIGALDFLTWAGWLPDGRLVIEAGSKSKAATVSIVPAEGGAAAQLLPAGMLLGDIGANAISPDGALIAAIDGQSRLMVCTIAAPACRPIPGADRGESVAGWMADGKTVITYRTETGIAKVDRLDITTGRRTTLTTIRPIEPALSGLGGVIAAPDGAIAYFYNYDASQLYVIKGLK
jgi:hypothetical protein